MNTKHTPLPWVFAYGAIYRSDTLHDESSIRLAQMDRTNEHTTPTERDANAAFIVKAVNAHDKLVELAAQLQIENQTLANTLRQALAENMRLNNAHDELVGALERCVKRLNYHLADVETCDIESADELALDEARSILAKVGEGR